MTCSYLYPGFSQSNFQRQFFPATDKKASFNDGRAKLHVASEDFKAKQTLAPRARSGELH